MLERYIAPFEIKSLHVDEEKSTATITGYAAVFGNLDNNGDIIRQGAFKSWIASNETAIPILLDHKMDFDHTAGYNYKAMEDEKGLFVQGELNLKTPAGQVAYQNAKQASRLGRKIGLSIGFYTKDFDYDNSTQVRYLKELDVVEYSFTHSPANSNALVTDVKSLIEEGDTKKIAEHKRFIERTLRDVCGVSKKAAETAVSAVFSDNKNVEVPIETESTPEENPEDIKDETSEKTTDELVEESTDELVDESKEDVLEDIDNQSEVHKALEELLKKLNEVS